MESCVVIKHDGFYRINRWERWGIQAFVTSRRWDMGFDAQVNTKKDSCARAAAFEAMGLSVSGLVCPNQTHEAVVRSVVRRDAGQGCIKRSSVLDGVDALVTKDPELPVAVLTADCLPVFISDVRKKVIGIVHGGWKGLRLGIVASAVEAMMSRYGCEVADLSFAFGPCLRGCCYEVGEEFAGYFPDSVGRREGRLYMDLVQAAALQLRAAGVREHQMADTRMCTGCLNREFFSYRREGASCGRQMSVIVIRHRRRPRCFGGFRPKTRRADEPCEAQARKPFGEAGSSTATMGSMRTVGNERCQPLSQDEGRHVVFGTD